MCIAGRRIAAWDIACRFAAGDSQRAIAKDMRLSSAQVEAALQLWIEAAKGFRGWAVEDRMAWILDRAASPSPAR